MTTKKLTWLAVMLAGTVLFSGSVSAAPRPGDYPDPLHRFCQALDQRVERYCYEHFPVWDDLEIGLELASGPGPEGTYRLDYWATYLVEYSGPGGYIIGYGQESARVLLEVRVAGAELEVTREEGEVLEGLEGRKNDPAVTMIADQAYQQALLDLLARARESVAIVHFSFFTEEGFTRQVAEKLVAMKRERPELAIRILLEGDKTGVGERNQKTLALLFGTGIEVKLDAPARVTHAKLVVVDGREALLGSHNLSNNSLRNNNETSLLITSPEAVAGLQAWAETVMERPGGPATTRCVDGSVTVLTDASYFEEARRMIQEARTSLDLAMYFIAYRDEQDLQVKSLLDELVAAAGRGVRVRVLLEQSDTFSLHITEANLRAARFLWQGGIREIYFDRKDKLSHAKYLVRDGEESLVGSTNWYAGDLGVGHQVNALVRDAGLAGQLAGLLSGKIAGEGTPFPGDAANHPDP